MKTALIWVYVMLAAGCGEEAAESTEGENDRGMPADLSDGGRVPDQAMESDADRLSPDAERSAPDAAPPAPDGGPVPEAATAWIMETLSYGGPESEARYGSPDRAGTLLAPFSDVLFELLDDAKAQGSRLALLAQGPSALFLRVQVTSGSPDAPLSVAVHADSAPGRISRAELTTLSPPPALEAARDQMAIGVVDEGRSLELELQQVHARADLSVNPAEVVVTGIVPLWSIENLSLSVLDVYGDAILAEVPVCEQGDRNQRLGCLQMLVAGAVAQNADAETTLGEPALTITLVLAVISTRLEGGAQ